MEFNNEFELPNGILTDTGLIKKVSVKEMSGEDEERLGGLKDSNRLYIELFCSLVSVDGKELTPETAGKVTLGDADFLMVKIRQTSFGEILEMSATCPSCKEKIEGLRVPLNELPIKAQTKLVTPSQSITGTLPRSGADIVVQLPTVSVQEKIAPLAKRNGARATTAFLTIVTKKVSTSDVISEDVFRKMSKMDRDYIGRLIEKNMGGMEMDIDIVCNNKACNFAFTTPLDMTNFFTSATSN